VPEPPLSDDLIALRPLQPSDAIAIAEACADPLIPKFTFMPDNLTPYQAVEWVERRKEQWRKGQVAGFAIVAATDRRNLVGTIGVAVDRERVSGEVFYWIAAHARLRGFATRSVRLISAWAFEDLGLQRLELLTHPENEASQRVAVAAGYSYEGTLRSHQPFKGVRMDSVLYSLLPEDRTGDAQSPRHPEGAP
jgi:RimJ/RimL family protein N-acetyltransferase